MTKKRTKKAKSGHPAKRVGVQRRGSEWLDRPTRRGWWVRKVMGVSHPAHVDIAADRLVTVSATTGAVVYPLSKAPGSWAWMTPQPTER